MIGDAVRQREVAHRVAHGDHEHLLRVGHVLVGGDLRDQGVALREPVSQRLLAHVAVQLDSAVRVAAGDRVAGEAVDEVVERDLGEVRLEARPEAGPGQVHRRSAGLVELVLEVLGLDGAVDAAVRAAHRDGGVRHGACASEHDRGAHAGSGGGDVTHCVSPSPGPTSLYPVRVIRPVGRSLPCAA